MRAFKHPSKSKKQWKSPLKPIKNSNIKLKLIIILVIIYYSVNIGVQSLYIYILQKKFHIEGNMSLVVFINTYLQEIYKILYLRL